MPSKEAMHKNRQNLRRLMWCPVCKRSFGSDSEHMDYRVMLTLRNRTEIKYAKQGSDEQIQAREASLRLEEGAGRAEPQAGPGDSHE